DDLADGVLDHREVGDHGLVDIDGAELAERADHGHGQPRDAVQDQPGPLLIRRWPRGPDCRGWIHRRNTRVLVCPGPTASGDCEQEQNWRLPHRATLLSVAPISAKRRDAATIRARKCDGDHTRVRTATASMFAIA